ncbi:MAG: hypothetical protein ACKPB0_16965 [Opitutaceae bacterium]
MKYHQRLIVVAALALANALLAQTAEPAARPAPRGGPDSGPGRAGGPGGPGGGRGSPVIRTLDTNHDHEISAQEIALAPSVLPMLDLNGDGVVSADELRGGRPAGDAGRLPPPDGAMRPAMVDPVMFALDANADGSLAAAEIANAAASLRALDANQDGKLTRDEFRPLPPAPPRD